MVSAFTVNKRLEQPSFNSYIDTWHVPVNTDWETLDKALGGLQTINLTGLSGIKALTAAECVALKIRLTGGPTGNITVTVPNLIGGMWVVRNDCTGSFSVAFASTTAPAVVVVIPAASQMLVTCDGSVTGMLPAITTLATAAGLNGQIQLNASGVLGAVTGLAWDSTNSRLSTIGLINSGNTQLGDGPGDVVTIVGSAVSFSATSGLAFNSNHLVLLGGSGDQVGIGTATVNPADMLTVAGRIRSSAGGVVFPDGTVQASAAATGGSGTVAGANTQVQYNNAGAFGAESGFTYNQTTNTLAVPIVTLTTPLAVTSGGTGVVTSTGSGANVLATAPALVSPAMTGIPTVPTAVPGTNTLQAASTAFVRAEASAAAGVSRVLATGHFQVSGGAIGASKLTGATVAYVSAGRYRVTLSTAAPDSDYTVLVTAAGAFGGTYGFEVAAVARTTSVFEIGSGGISVAYADPAYMNFTVHV